LACKTAFNWADKRFHWDSEPDATGFMRARARITEEDCTQLLESAKNLAHNTLRRTKRLVRGLLPIGVDGSILHMPRSDALVKEYGVPKDRFGIETCHYPQALLVTAWDLVRRIPLAWSMVPFASSERSVLLELLTQLPKNALLILDRGYPSDVVFGEILASGRHFVARMVCSEGASWSEVAAFLASGKRDAIVPVEVGIGKSRRVVLLRMVLRAFDVGRPHKHQKRETMVVITSVTDLTLTMSLHTSLALCVVHKISLASAGDPSTVLGWTPPFLVGQIPFWISAPSERSSRAIRNQVGTSFPKRSPSIGTG
jgi:hypothetical protein